MSTQDKAAPDWHKLALQFDGQRMAAMVHLRTLLTFPDTHADVVRKFLAASPSEQIASTKQAALSELTANAEKLGLYEASTQQAEPSLRKQLQRRCSEWGAYWRASDSHGVELTSAQAVELLEEALGVEVEIEQAEPAQAAVPAPKADPVAEFRGRRQTPEGTVEFWGVMLCDPMQDPPKGSKLYAGPINDPVTRDWRSVIPGGRFTDKWESARIADFNEGWNAYRKAVIAALAAQPKAEPVQRAEAYGWCYEMWVGGQLVGLSSVMAGRVHLDVPFGKAGEDHSGEVREVMLYTHPAPAQAPLTEKQIVLAANEAFDTHIDLDDDTLVSKYGHGIYVSRFIDFCRAIERACAAAWGVKLEGGR